MKFIHAADLHLDSPLLGLEKYPGAPAEEIRAATRRALEHLVAAALEHEVQFVLLAGDNYDGDWKDHNTGLFFSRQMSRLGEAGIPVVQISGNHDAQNKMTLSLRLPGNVHVLGHQQPETLLGEDIGLAQHEVAFHGQSFATAAVTENLARAYPPALSGRFNIGLLHTSLAGPGSEHARYAPCSLGDLMRLNYQYWALGHVHQREIVNAQPAVVFPGNIQGRHIRETGPKGAMLVQVDAHHRTSLTFLPLDVFRWEICPVKLAELATEDDLFTSVQEALARLQQNAEGRPQGVRVVLSGRTALHAKLLARPQWLAAEIRNVAGQLGGAGVWVEKVLVRTHPPALANERSLEDGPLGELHAYLQELSASDELLGELAQVLADLERSLPHDLKSRPDGLALSNPAWLRERLLEVEPLLRERLLATEAQP